MCTFLPSSWKKLVPTPLLCHYLGRNGHSAKKDAAGMPSENDDTVEYPIDGTLDLHQFAPGETRDVVLEYVRACLEQKIYTLRIVHGKGIGVQREIVHSVLSGHPHVASFRHEGGSGGGWGATVVDLKP